MKRATTIDYTARRLGTRVSPTRKIERCPRCGRKGALKRATDLRSGGRPLPPRWMCEHVVEAVTRGGYTYARVDDMCMGPIEADGTLTVITPKGDAP